MSVILPLLLIGCLALGVALLLWPKRAGLFSTHLAALPLGIGGLGLLLVDDVRVRLPMQWLPDQVPAGLVLTGSARYLVAGVLAWAVLSLWQHNDLSPPAWPSYGPGLMLITSALTILAVTIDHFLLRYVTLELVALVTAACLAVAFPAYRGAPLLWRAYLPWRLGGAALLFSILVLERGTGTFSIADALSGALDLSPGPRMVAGVGAAAAAWVKLGLPPFHGWLMDGARAPRVLWPIGNVLPLLGAYLLQRFQYVLAPPGGWIGVTLLAGAPVAAGLWHSERVGGMSVGSAGLAQRWWPVWHGALAFPAVALGLGSWYLATFVPVRLALGGWLWHRGAESATALDTRQDKTSGQLPELMRLVAAAVARLEGGMDAFATGHPSRFVVNVAAPAMHGVERWLEALVDETVAGIGILSARVQRWHTGRLRINLLWAVFALSGVVLAALIIWGY